MAEDRAHDGASVPPPAPEETYSRAFEEVERLRGEVEKKVSELDRALDRLQHLEEPRGEPRGEVAEPVLGRPTQARAGANNPRADKSGDDQMMHEATLMAVAGKDRRDIEAMLSERYGIETPRPLVDEILGAE